MVRGLEDFEGFAVPLKRIGPHSLTAVNI